MTDLDWYLPFELTEKILFNLDGRSLARASVVCKKWNDSFRNLADLYNIWKICCKREIPSEQLINIIDKLFPIVTKEKKIDWLIVYKCWMSWFKLENWNHHSVVLLESYDSQIKCLKVSGDWIIYGTIHEGKIKAYNYETKECFLVHGGLGVIDMDLYNTVHFSSDSDKMFPHDGIIALLSNYSIIRISLDDMEKINSYHNGDYANNVRYLLEWILSVKRNLAFKMDSIGLKYNTHDGWTKRITKRQNVRVNLIGEVVLLPKDHKLSASEIFVDSVVEITHWYQVNYNVSFGMAYRSIHVLFILVNDRIKAYLPPDQLFNVTSVFMHCNMLFLGNNKGTVFVYRLESSEDLLKFNFLNYIQKYKISNDPIKAIDVQYDLKTSNKQIPFLVVATTLHNHYTTSIHKIHFK